jgi:hypothetical protein
MTVDELNELTQRIAAGAIPNRAECEAMLAEIWRLKALVAGKSMELDLARDETNYKAAELTQAMAENTAQRHELAHLRELAELSTCALENRWSNCAVRIKKRTSLRQD